MDKSALIIPSMQQDLFAGILDNQILLVFAAIIIFLFVVYMVRMLLAYRKLNKSMRGLHRSLLATCESSSVQDLRGKMNVKDWQNNYGALLNAGRFDEIFEHYKQDSHGSWEGLKEHFIWFGDRSMPYLSSGAVQQLFSPEQIRSKFVSGRLNRRGGLFTTLGVLGTFLGLSYGVSQASSGLASADITLARQAMSDLLNGAQLAFVTSLLGLVCSMFYGLILERKRDASTQAIYDLHNVLNTIFPAMSAAYAGAQQAAALHKQQDDIKNILERIAQASYQTSKQVGELRKEIPEGIDKEALQSIENLLKNVVLSR